MAIDEEHWSLLFQEAERVIRETMQQMPEELRAEAERVPCLLERWPPDGEEALGHYLSFEGDVVSEGSGPIVLYLGTIQQDCEELGLDYADELRITFLHELGHHLGLDEADLEKRGLL